MIKSFMNRYKTSELFRHIFWITIVYVLAQGLLLIVSGLWWDDWVVESMDWGDRIAHAIRQGVPLRAYINASLRFLPDDTGKILVFIYFYIGSLLAYTIMKKIDAFSSEAAFWITLLYITIPINDARILWCCYDYAVALFLFWISFWLVTLWQGGGKTGKKSVALRVLSLVILVFSYYTDSIMFMTLVILLYLYYEKLRKEWKWGETRANIMVCFKTVLHYMDFLLVPVVYYFVKNIFFPSDGISRYLDWQAVPGLIPFTPIYAWETMIDLLLNYIFALLNHTVLIMLAVTVICYLLVSYMCWHKKTIKIETDVLLRDAVIMFLVGIFCFFVGFFPYAIFYKGAFETTGTTGRLSLLLGIGVAMIFYYLADIVFRREIRKMMLVLCIVLGVCHFNLMYLDWQASYYQELRFQAEIAENQNILNNDTFLYLDYYQVFYVLNAISYVTTGDESRLYLSIDSLSTLADMYPVALFRMREWDYSPENRHLDGILLFNDAPISNSELIKLKFEELFDKDAFNRYISETKDITFIPVTEEESDVIIKAAQEGTLTRDNIFDYVGAY